MKETSSWEKIDSFKWKNHFLCSFIHVWLFATPWIVACLAPLSLGFSRQEYLSGLPCPLPGDLSWPRDWSCISYVWQVSALPLVPLEKSITHSTSHFQAILSFIQVPLKSFNDSLRFGWLFILIVHFLDSIITTVMSTLIFKYIYSVMFWEIFKNWLSGKQKTKKCSIS